VPSHLNICVLWMMWSMLIQRGCKGNLTILRRILHLDLAKANPK
jgi:hypothetical protein